MRSWIFRHRLRLRGLYAPRLVPDPRARPRRALGPDRAGLLPGECRRRGVHVWLRPPARAA